MLYSPTMETNIMKYHKAQTTYSSQQTPTQEVKLVVNSSQGWQFHAWLFLSKVPLSKTLNPICT